MELIEERYSRQVLYPGIGRAGPEATGASHVAVVGCGATGAAAAALLARAGVGTLTLVDRDFVEESNLQRQVLFDEADAREALPKAEAARRKIAQFNSRPRCTRMWPIWCRPIFTPCWARRRLCSTPRITSRPATC